MATLTPLTAVVAAKVIDFKSALIALIRCNLGAASVKLDMLYDHRLLVTQMFYQHKLKHLNHNTTSSDGDNSLIVVVFRTKSPLKSNANPANADVILID